MGRGSGRVEEMESSERGEVLVSFESGLMSLRASVVGLVRGRMKASGDGQGETGRDGRGLPASQLWVCLGAAFVRGDDACIFWGFCWKDGSEEKTRRRDDVFVRGFRRVKFESKSSPPPRPSPSIVMASLSSQPVLLSTPKSPVPLRRGAKVRNRRVRVWSRPIESSTKQIKRSTAAFRGSELTFWTRRRCFVSQSLRQSLEAPLCALSPCHMFK